MRWQGTLAAAALLALVAVSFAPAARLGFVYDDHELIVDREAPRGLEIARVFAERHWPTLPYYRPIPRASMLAQKAVHGDDPAPYHVANVLLAAAVALAALALLRTAAFGLTWPLALAGASLFALHPIASSCVYPIASGRETLWPTFFEILAVIAYLRPRGPSLGLCLAATGAALLSKEHAVVLPLVFVAADLLGLSRAPRREPLAWLRRHARFALLVLGYFGVRQLIFAGEPRAELALLSQPFGPLLSFGYALQVFFAPTRDLVYEPIAAVWISPVRLALALAASAAIGLGIAARDPAAQRRGLFWLAWIALGLLPTANVFVQDARFDERYVFFSSLGLVALALTALEPLGRARTGRAITAVGLAAGIATAATVSIERASAFADDAAFLARWIESDPERAQPHLSLGKLAYRAGDWAAAIAHFEAALARSPELADAHNGLGLAQEALGRIDLAEQHFARAIELDPANGAAHNDLGVLYLGRGELARSEAEFEAALAGRGDHTSARINLALVHARAGDRATAIAELEQVLAARPGHAGACFNLGMLLVDAGDDARALPYLERAVDARPDYAIARFRLGIALVRLGRAGDAETELRRALELDASLDGARSALAQLGAQP